MCEAKWRDVVRRRSGVWKALEIRMEIVVQWEKAGIYDGEFWAARLKTASMDGCCTPHSLSGFEKGASCLSTSNEWNDWRSAGSGTNLDRQPLPVVLWEYRSRARCWR